MVRRSIGFILVCWVAIIASTACLLSAQTDSAIDVLDPGPNRPDEPYAEKYSADQAANFLDAASLQWQQQRKCMTCHTNYAYLYARPAIESDSSAHQRVRGYAEQLVNQRWKEKGPRWDAEVVATAAALAFNDASTSGKLHQTTRAALDRMWDVQRKDGSWSWLKCGWPPMESDDHYGVTLAVIGVGAAPGNYAQSKAARMGMEKIRGYLKDTPPTTLHHQAMLLWGSSYFEDLISTVDKQNTIESLLALQKKDGGWALATLGDWKRTDGEEQDLKTSDGYGTGFVIYALLRGGFPPDSEPVKRGIHWLKTHQRESGRWFTRSLNRDGMHFISHAGTAMAMMAIVERDRLKKTPADPSPGSSQIRRNVKDKKKGT